MVSVVSINQPGHLNVSRVKTVLSKDPLELISGDIAVFIAVAGHEGVMAVETRSSAESLPQKLSALLNTKVDLEGLKNLISGISCKELGLCVAVVEVVCFSGV